MATETATSPLGTHRFVGHARLERLLTDLMATIDAAAVIPGTGRRYERLDLGDGLAGLVDGWRIAWPPGYGLGMHDHGGSEAVVSVIRSSLCERYLDASGVRRRRLGSGIVRLPTDHVHEMVNTSPIEAVSIHLYSPPLDRTDFGADRAVEFTVVSVAP